MHPKHFDFTGVWRGQTLADLDCGRLASAVGAEQSEALARPNLEVKSGDGDNIVVRLSEISDTKGDLLFGFDHKCLRYAFA